MQTRLKCLINLTFIVFFISSALTADPSSSLHQEKTFISASVGDTITVTCVPRNKQVSKIFWYKQTLGQQPKLMISFHGSSEKSSFVNEWKDDPRFRLKAETNRHHLIILNVTVSDTGTYYCATTQSFKLGFEEGTLVSVKGSGLTVPALVHQSESEAVQHGGSVTLSCSVHTGGCDGEHSVYWFKDSEESHPGLIYTHGGRNHQCERRHSTETNTCVYNLPLRSLNVSHAGTYYCAVVSCGHILFGNGTKLDVESKSQSLITFRNVSSYLGLTFLLDCQIGGIYDILAFYPCLKAHDTLQFGV